MERGILGATQFWIDEFYLPNNQGQIVRVHAGDKVDLASVASTSVASPGKNGTAWYGATHISQERADTLRSSLGQGPYEVTRMCEWPCCRVMFYLKTENHVELGVFAPDLISVKNSTI